MSAIESESKLIIGSMTCDSKISEPKIFRKLVDILDVSGAMLVANALHCQKESAAKGIEVGGDYLFVVKENQPTLHKEIELYFQNEKTENYSKAEKNGVRIEKSTAYVVTDIDWLTGKDDWKKLTTIGAIHTEFTKGETKSSEWHYYISSRKLSAQELLKHARLEWAVESMHWLLDVHFSEDKTKVWDMNVQQNLNIIPLRYPMNCDILRYDGILTNICMWSLHASASMISTYFCSHNFLNISPISFLNVPYISCLLNLGAKTI